MSLPPVTEIRSHVTSRTQRLLTRFAETEADHVDRAIVATALVATAVVVIWPEARTVPKLVAGAAGFVRAAWAKKDLWLPVVTNP